MDTDASLRPFSMMLGKESKFDICQVRFSVSVHACVHVRVFVRLDVCQNRIVCDEVFANAINRRTLPSSMWILFIGANRFEGNGCQRLLVAKLCCDCFVN